ncbi:unnamed protein product, partial [Polarella glacialis]
QHSAQTFGSAAAPPASMYAAPLAQAAPGVGRVQGVSAGTPRESSVGAYRQVVGMRGSLGPHAPPPRQGSVIMMGRYVHPQGPVASMPSSAIPRSQSNSILNSEQVYEISVD